MLACMLDVCLPARGAPWLSVRCALAGPVSATSDERLRRRAMRIQRAMVARGVLEAGSLWVCSVRMKRPYC